MRFTTNNIIPKALGYLLLLQLLQQANLERCITTGGLKQGQARLRNLSWRDQYDTEGNETEIMFDRKRLVLCKYKLYTPGRHWSGWRASATKSTSLMPLPGPFLALVCLKMNINQSLSINLLLYIELLNL